MSSWRPSGWDDLPSIFMAAMQARRQRAREERDDELRSEQFGMEKQRFQMDLDRQKAAESRAAAAAEARAAFLSGDPVAGNKYRLYDPQGYAADMAANRDETKFRAEQQTMQQAMGQKRAEATDRFKQQVAPLLAQNPGAASMVDKIKAAKVASGEIEDFALPEQAMPEGLMGPGMVDTQAMREQAAVGMASRPPPEGLRPTGDMIEYEAAMKDPKFAAYQERMRRAGASQVNVGGKDLPAAQVAEMGDIDFLREGVGGLLESFKRDVSSNDIVGQATSRGVAFVPNTDTANYDLQADMFAQKLGTTLEGGKLTDADYRSKYRNMVPRPGDSPETANRKIANIQNLLSGYSSARESAFSRSGYRVPRGEKKPRGPGGAAAETVTSGAGGVIDPRTGPSADDLESLWGR